MDSFRISYFDTLVTWDRVVLQFESLNRIVCIIICAWCKQSYFIGGCLTVCPQLSQGTLWPYWVFVNHIMQQSPGCQRLMQPCTITLWLTPTHLILIPPFCLHRSWDPSSSEGSNAPVAAGCLRPCASEIATFSHYIMKQSTLTICVYYRCYWWTLYLMTKHGDWRLQYGMNTRRLSMMPRESR